MSDVQSLSLNGTWKLCWSDGMRGRMEYVVNGHADASRYIGAHVPGEVHLDLMRAGWIGDTNTELHALEARWVEECLWSYRREFVAPAASRRGRAWLNFAGLDLAATIFLNGEEVGKHLNSFTPCRVEVTGKLKPGRNVLTVHLDAGLYYAADKQVEGMAHGLDQRLHKRHWLRKPQSQASWDWSPRLLNVGIHGTVSLEWTADPARVDRMVPIAEVAPDLKRGTVRVRLFVEGLRPKPFRARLTAALKGTGVTGSTDVEIKPGLHPVDVTLTIDRPNLWWPVGHGAQDRYGLEVALRAGGKILGTRSATIGFRRVVVNQDPHLDAGRYFRVEINNKPIFWKGANMVPADTITARLDRKRYETLISRALEANFNCLRVWGGGLYESDDFYELCDAKGILVWQEFIFACAKYPTIDEAFYRNVKEEAVHQIRRLASHPSLVIWCGNNEMEEGSWHWGYDKGTVLPDYAWFHLTLPRLLKAEDPSRYYQPSSPLSPDGRDPNDAEVGDQHPWTVGFHNTDFRDYRTMVSRFPNEGGILGPPALKTLKACLPPGTTMAKDSLHWDQHENSIAFWEARRPPDRMIEEWVGKKRQELTLEQYVYWAGVVQGEGIAEYIKNFRRRMFSSAAAIFWMYNDTWPATRSWTIVDYYLRRTPAFWAVKRAFAPIIVVVVREENRVKVFGVNEGPVWSGDLRYGLFSFKGKYPLDETKWVTLPPNTSTLIAEFDATMWDKLGPKRHAAFAILSQDGREAARDRLILPRFRELELPKARPTFRRGKGGTSLVCNSFAWQVCLDLDGEAQLRENFVDVYPGIPTPVSPSAKIIRSA